MTNTLFILHSASVLKHGSLLQISCNINNDDDDDDVQAQVNQVHVSYYSNVRTFRLGDQTAKFVRLRYITSEVAPAGGRDEKDPI